MDGELMERLWSYLRSFSKITKEMTPAHRTDLLSDALMHFGSKKMGNIGLPFYYYFVKYAKTLHCLLIILILHVSNFSTLGNYLVFLYNKANQTIKSCESEIKNMCSQLPGNYYQFLVTYICCIFHSYFHSLGLKNFKFK